MSTNTNATKTLIDDDACADEPVRMWWDPYTKQEVTSGRTTLNGERIAIFVNWAGDIVAGFIPGSPIGSGWTGDLGSSSGF